MKFIGRFFLLVSGVDLTLIGQCPRVERQKHISVGITLLLTSCFAFFSSFYAFVLLTDNTYIAVFLALIWSVLIFNLDRFLVSSFRFSESYFKNIVRIIPRLCLTVFIALVIAKPIELKLFQSELELAFNERQLNLLRGIEESYQSKIDEVRDRLNQKETSIAQLFEQKERYYEDYKCECDGTCGTKRYGRGAECERKKAKYESFSKEYTELKNEGLADVKALKDEIIVLQENSSSEKLRQETSFASLGLSARLTLLEDVPGNAGLFITLLFVLVESIPISTKIIVGPGSYEKVLAQVEHSFKLLQDTQIKKADLIAASLLEEERVNSELDFKKHEHELKLRRQSKVMRTYSSLRRQLNDEMRKNEA